MELVMLPVSEPVLPVMEERGLVGGGRLSVLLWRSPDNEELLLLLFLL